MCLGHNHDEVDGLTGLGKKMKRFTSLSIYEVLKSNRPTLAMYCSWNTKSTRPFDDFRLRRLGQRNLNLGSRWHGTKQ